MPEESPNPMAKLSAAAPHWAQRRAAYEAESRGEDPTPYIQTAPGGTPGRIQGVSALQRIAAMQASRARTSLPRRRSQAEIAAAQPVASSAPPPDSTADLATQQFENRRKRLMGGGISAPEADLEARNEFQASPSFVGPRNVNRPYRAAFVGPRNIAPGKDQGALATIRESMKRRPRVQY
jgi:hypothetical protein